MTTVEGGLRLLVATGGSGGGGLFRGFSLLLKLYGFGGICSWEKQEKEKLLVFFNDVG